MSHPAPYGREVRIRIGGPAGFGIKAAGQTLARVFARAGYHTFDLTEYPSLIKGGHNTYQLRVSEDEIFSHVMPTDILVALDADTIALHLRELTSGGAIVFDPHDVAAEAIDLGGRDDVCLVPVPLTDIVYEVGGIKIMRNVVALGAVLGHMGFPVDGLLDSLRHQFAHKAPEIAEQNVAAATRGFEVATEAQCDFPYKLAPREIVEPFVLADGNEAMGVGALAAGLGFYAAYPMTPASSLLSFMAKNADANDVVVKHTEDEIAAMNMVVGSAFGGTRSMCATSGGGFSLMVEALGFAGVSESAVVVGLFTRPGPATGLPTWTEQSDLRFAIHAAQGEFPRVVLAPGDHSDAFELSWKAFNLADQLQTPVILLGDTYLCDNRQTRPAFDTAAVTIDRGELQTTGEVSDYTRYKVTDSGVSPRALPGVVGAQQIVNSYEHDETGWGAPGEEVANRVAQMDKRLRKFKLAEQLVPPPVEFGPHQAQISIILFGTTKMPALEASKWLAAEGVTVNVLQLVTVWPFPAQRVREFLERAGRSIVIEQNATGQLDGLIREHTLREAGHRLNRYDGRPISPEQIYAFVHDILGRHVDSYRCRRHCDLGRRPLMPAVKEFTTSIKPTWCPGCGNFGMWEALKRALSELGWEKNEFAVVWGIGCHGNGADFLDVQGMHALHGRAVPPATALRMTRPDLHVIVEMGDGDGYGIGLGHYVHALRRNPDLTIIAHNNQIYGLTTGQASPTTDHLMRTVSTPGGVLEEPVNPIGLALAENATFVARGFAGDIPHLAELYKKALTHKGLAVVDVFQPCVTWNHLNTFKWFRDRVYKLEESDWDVSDRAAAFELSMTAFHELTCTPDTCRVPIGVYYQREGVPTYEDGVPASSEPGWKRAEKPRDVSAILAGLG